MATIGEISTQLSEPLRQTYYVIITHAYDHAGNVPSLRCLSRTMHVPWQTLVYRMNALCSSGLIRKVGRGRSLSYELAGSCFEINFQSPPFVSVQECNDTGEDYAEYTIQIRQTENSPLR